jgi:hypothetical protein
MRRIATVVAGAVLLIPAAVAEGKEVAAAKVCGATSCREVEDPERLGALPLGGTPTDPPAAAAEWYRMEVVMGADRVRERFASAVVPSANRMRGDGGFWLRPGSADLKAFRELVRGLEPKPAATFGDIEPPVRARVDEVVEPPAEPAVSDGLAWQWIAAAAAGALAGLAVMALRLRRRRLRRGGPASTAPVEG